MNSLEYINKLNIYRSEKLHWLADHYRKNDKLNTLYFDRSRNRKIINQARK